MAQLHGWPERAVSALASEQRLLVAAWQLRELGIAPSTVAEVLERGRLHRYAHGVYAVVELGALPPLAAEQGAILVCGPDAVISHRSAAAIWDLVEHTAGPVSVTVVGSDRGRARAGIDFHRTGALARVDVRRNGLPLTAPARTLIDMAAVSSYRQAELALDRALTRQLTSPTALRNAIERCPTRAGVATVAGLLDPARPSSMTVSPPEELLLSLVRRAGLPAPEANVPLGDPHSPVALERYRPDLMWRAQRVVVEFDSRQYHSSARAIESDNRRDAAVIRAGWTVIRVRYRELVQAPERVLVRIAGALARSGCPV
ncbi:MAG TPA: DUF559 domain-containing protein [Solirubrobacteraceae bacterium]|nr:DUF559 domain-containing protein [Solirubrobacteraceae bacterium]